MSEFVIETQELTKIYGEQICVDSVSLHVRKGTIYGLLGRNGAGKTTTIKCLMEYIFADSGSIQFFQDQSILESKKRIGFLPERPYFQEFLSGVEFLRLHWSLAGLDQIHFQERAFEVLEQVKELN